MVDVDTFDKLKDIDGIVATLSNSSAKQCVINVQDILKRNKDLLNGTLFVDEN